MKEAMWLTWRRMLHLAHSHCSESQSSCSSVSPSTSGATRSSRELNWGKTSLPGVVSGMESVGMDAS